MNGHSELMKISVDQPKCISAGLCVVAAPEVFDQREEDGVVELLNAEPGPELEEAVTKAARLCPATAIRLGSA